MNPHFSINQFRDKHRTALNSLIVKVVVSAGKTSRPIQMVRTVVDGKEIYVMEEPHGTAA